MNYGLIIYYALIFICLLQSAHRHGKQRQETENFLTTLAASVLTLVIVWWALGWKIDPFTH